MAAVGLLGASAVILGAFGAHGLKNQLATGLITTDQLNGFDTGVKYQMYHTLALLMVFILQTKFESKFLNWSKNLFLFGILLFSGSLYLLTTRNLIGADFLKALGPVTPVGGLFFVGGWICLILFSFNGTKENNK